MKFKLAKDVPPYKAGLEVDAEFANDLNRQIPGACVAIEEKIVEPEPVFEVNKTKQEAPKSTRKKK